MGGVLGCIGRALVDAAALDAMMARALRFGGGLSQRETGSSDFLGVCGLSGTGGIFRRGELVAALHGHPFWEAGGKRLTGTAEVAERFLERFSQQGRESISSLHGDFALAVIDRARSELTLAVDRMSVHNIVYARTREGIVFGPGCDVVSRHPSVETQVDQQSLYNFIYFHMVPGPATV